MTCACIYSAPTDTVLVLRCRTTDSDQGLVPVLNVVHPRPVHNLRYIPRAQTKSCHQWQDLDFAKPVFPIRRAISELPCKQGNNQPMQGRTDDAAASAV